MLYRCILSRDLCGCREEKRETTRARGNTYDFIILTLIHIHRAAMYVPLFICLMLAMTRRVRKTSFHAATGGGINYLSSRVILPRSREVAPSEKARFHSRSLRATLWHEVSAVFLSFRVRQIAGRVRFTYIPGRINNPYEPGVELRERSRGITTWLFRFNALYLMRPDYHPCTR